MNVLVAIAFLASAAFIMQGCVRAVAKVSIGFWVALGLAAIAGISKRVTGFIAPDLSPVSRAVISCSLMGIAIAWYLFSEHGVPIATGLAAALFHIICIVVLAFILIGTGLLTL